MTDQERAFEELFRATYPRVLGYARTMAADAHAADDAVADAYAVAWRRLADVPAGGEAGWLIAVTRRVLANQRRGRRRADALRERLRLQPSAAFPDPAARIEDEELRAALRALRPLDREALVLVAWFDLTPDEAAAVLGVRPAALRMRLTRARRRLRAGLEPSAFDRPLPAHPATEEPAR